VSEEVKKELMNEDDAMLTPFDRFMSGAKILIVDHNFTHRIALKQSLLAFGAAAENITMAKNLKEGRKESEKINPSIIFSDFLLEDGVSTHLLKERTSPVIFILISSIATQSAIANAAEAEVDQFIFKPYSQVQLKDILDECIRNKTEGNETSKYIEDGKGLLAIGEFERAREFFEKVKLNQKTFSLACSYLGEIKKLENEWDESFKIYKQGLASTEIHFRCMFGLFSTLLQNGRKEEAYNALKDILVHFPECPDRLSQALDLAVHTKNFVDIEEMHLVFQLMYEKPQKLIVHMSSALLVNGHYHLRHKNQLAAMESFVRGMIIGKGNVKFSQYVQEKLAQFGLEAKYDEIVKSVESKNASTSASTPSDSTVANTKKAA